MRISLEEFTHYAEMENGKIAAFGIGRCKVCKVVFRVTSMIEMLSVPKAVRDSMSVVARIPDRGEVKNGTCRICLLKDRFSALMVKDRDERIEKTINEVSMWADRVGHRRDWHEPDEQSVTATVIGDHLDNACGSEITKECQEYVVILKQEGGEELAVNLADLLAAASYFTRK